MATTPEQWAAQDEAFSKQYDAEQAQKAQQEAAAKSDQPPSLMSQFGTALGQVSHVVLDDKIAAAQGMFRLGRDAAAGAITGATNTADAVVKGAAASGTGLAMAEDPEHAQAALEANLTSPVWDHAKAALLDFRDAVAVKDPTMADNIVQGVAQLAIPFAGYSRALSGMHGIARMVAAGAVTDATALQPHDMRMADMIALGRTTEGKLGDVLRTLAPDGSALNAYIGYLSDRGGPDTSAYKVTPGNEAANPEQWGKRADGSSKGQGFLGLLQRPDGRVSSELSIGVNIDGKDVEVPTLVPTLSKSEVDYLMTNKPDPKSIPRSIVEKAVEFARTRIAQGKSPFAGVGEGPETEAEGTFKNVLDGLGVNLVVTPLIAAAAATLKHGTAGLRYMIDNGVGSTSGMVPPPALQRGGPASAVGQDRMTRLMQQLHEQQHTAGAGVQYSAAGDLHTVTSDNGATTALQRGKDLRVIDTQTFKGRTGQGEGTARMERLLAEAQLKKLNLISDSQVSAPAQKVYERLRSMGYDVKENPSRLDAGTGEKFSASELKGVYEVRPKIVKE